MLRSYIGFAPSLTGPRTQLVTPSNKVQGKISSRPIPRVSLWSKRQRLWCARRYLPFITGRDPVWTCAALEVYRIVRWQTLPGFPATALWPQVQGRYPDLATIRVHCRPDEVPGDGLSTASQVQRCDCRLRKPRWMNSGRAPTCCREIQICKTRWRSRVSAWRSMQVLGRKMRLSITLQRLDRNSWKSSIRDSVSSKCDS